MKKIFIVFSLLLLSGCMMPPPGDELVECPSGFKDCVELESNLSIAISDLEYRAPLRSPIVISGKAKNYWFFEGNLPINLIDSNEDLIASGFAAAQGDWTAEGLIDFEGSLEFDTSASSGILQILSDNPSGLYENQLEFSFPVRFVKGMVREHIEANVGEINPIDPVLGGSWYVLEISFTADSSVLVTAEDGHIQSRFSADYVIDESGVVSLENILSVP